MKIALKLFFALFATITAVSCDNHTSDEVTPSVEEFDHYYTFDNSERVELKAQEMAQLDEYIVVTMSTDEAFDLESNPVDYISIMLPIEAIGTEWDITSERTSLYSNLQCFSSPIGYNTELSAEPIKGGSISLTLREASLYDIAIRVELTDNRAFEAVGYAECQITEVGPKYDYYVAIDGQASELNSMLYLKNDTGGYGNQYVIALTSVADLATIEEIQSCDEYIFLSLGEDSFQSLLASGNLDPTTTTDGLYMFYVNTRELHLEDYVDDHSMVESAHIAATLDDSTNDLTLQIEYLTSDDVEVKVVALARYIAPAPPVIDYDSYFNSSLGKSDSTNSVGSSFCHTNGATTIYTLLVNNAHTYASIEDSVLVEFSIEGVAPFEEFDLDIASADSPFTLWFYNPYTEYHFKADNNALNGCEGRISLKEGALCIEFNNSSNGNGDTLTVSALCGTNTIRGVCECMEIFDSEHTPLFTPASVVIEKRGAECMIYVSSKRNVTSVEGMSDAEIVIFCPEGGWETLQKGYFMSGSAYPDMSITINQESYLKSNCAGLNCRIPFLNAEANTLTIIANTYTSTGGTALYYSGAYTLIE